MRFLEKLAQFICKNMALWVVIFSGIAFLYPAPFKPIGANISYLLGVIMLGMGLSMSLDDFRLVLTRPKDVFYGVFFRYLIMPVVGLCVAKLLGLPPALAAGMVLLGACPSGTGSNVMTYIAKGDTALSITVSSVNTILAPILTPYLFLALAGTMIPIEPGALFLDIVKIVLVPVAAVGAAGVPVNDGDASGARLVSVGCTWSPRATAFDVPTACVPLILILATVASYGRSVTIF